ncbi:signal peptidase I [Gordonia rubripertincta]|uniref:Signal peptidase I n=1 Tax=Gordonia rubripertincta TaxID=36822 RepID=A0AAW4G9U5_GORRU|nr:signal peptidase I [Gordonia rubripertincta]MBM7279880.1 signal peptidase I [Gordonia rubripertincta]QMU19416.1 signal peptidase I [Gordonia rubripertincta]TSD98712.1 signal peptidase I [Gordonia rubripertincta]
MADTQRPSDDRDLDTDGNDGEKRPWRLKSDPDETEDAKSKSGSGSLLREVAIIVGCVLLLTWLLQTFIGRQYVIPSESMESTLIGCDGCTNDRIVIDKMVYRFGDPEPGDVVVFKGPSESWNGAWVSPRSTNPVMHKAQDALSWFGFAPPDENNLVKRVIATGGQTIECRNDEGVGVKVDGKPLREPYINMELQRETLAAYGPDSGVSDKLPPCLGPDFGPIKVPEGNVWVMGDNRLNSQDSRYHVDDQYQGTVPVSDIRGKVRTIIYPFSRIGGVGSINPQQ